MRISGRWLVRTGALLVVFAGPRGSSAHPLDLGYLRVDSTGSRINIQLDLNRSAAAIALNADPDSLTPTIIERQAATLAERTIARAPIDSPTGPCTWADATATLQSETVSISTTATCPTGQSLRWRFPFVAERTISPRFQLIVKESHAGTERLTLIDETAPEIELAGGDGTSSSAETDVPHFIWSGFEHIGVAPDQWRSPTGGFQLPDGIDHILFLLALMLAGGTLAQLLLIATGFTLGHSITLALAVLDVVRPPASIIEPLIALSIALAAAEAFTGRWRTHRWKIAAGFGLIHGFGFATALSRVELTTRGKVSALFGYNLGIEIGQIVIVLIVAPVVLLAHRRESTLAIRAVASVIFLCGLYWFVGRTLELF